MGALYVVLVLAVGYVYCSINPAKKYKLARRDGYSLYFYIGFWGTIWTLIAIIFFFFLDLFDIPSWLLDHTSFKFKSFSTASAFTLSELKQLALCAGTLIATYCLAKFRQFYFWLFKAKRYKLMIKASQHNAAEFMLFTSINDYQPISLTLDSDKVYVGFVSDFDPIDGKVEYLTILPLLSGYRDDHKKLQFTTNYYEHYEKNIGDKAETPTNPEMQAILNKFKIIVPFSEIVSVSGFDVDAYKQFITSDFSSNSYQQQVKSVEASSYTYNSKA